MPAKRKRFWRRALWITSVVAIIVAMGVAGWMIIPPRKPQPPESMAVIQAAAASGRWADAESRLGRWLESHPKDAQARLMRGMMLANLGRLDDATESLRSISETDPARGQAEAIIGEIAFRARRAAEAERAFREAAARDPNAAEPRQRLIHLLSLQQRHGDARDFLWELFRARREPQILVSLVQNLSAYESDARSYTGELDEFLTQTPHDPFLRRIKGMGLLMHGRPAEALPHLEAAAEALVDDPVGRFALAECLMTLGRFKGDESILGPRPKSPADAARWSVLRGRLQEALGRPDDALASLRDAVSTNPEDVEANYRLGQVFQRVGKPDESKRQLARADAIKTKESTFRREFAAASRNGFDSDPPYEKLGLLCRAAGLVAEANAWFELAASHDPSSPSVQSALKGLPEGPASLPVALSRPVARKDVTAGEQIASAAKPPEKQPATRLVLEDVSAKSGISYQYDCGAKGDLYLGDTMGGGVGLFDYDGDGWLDIYFINGCRLPYDPEKPPGTSKLYRNRGDGTFEDVTARAGVPGAGYGMGCAVGDYDNDGHDDLFVTGLGRTVLYRNRGDGTFEDVTAHAGVGSDRWTTAAGFGDLDGDGDLDLVVITYVSADPINVPVCKDATGRPLHCSPARFDAQPDMLFRNEGNGTFTNISKESGIDAAPNGRGLGLAIADLDGDQKLDIFVANDLSPDFLFFNRGGLKFEESGMAAGVALNGSGRATSSMGVVADDLNGDGLTDLFITNFLNEPDSLFRNLGHGLFLDATLSANLHAAGPIGTGFGVAAPDFNNDGYPDLVMANGHADDQPWINTPMAQLPQAFMGMADGRFEAVDAPSVPYLSRRVVGRGLAAGDLDNDGRVDLVVVHRDSPAVLLRNTTPGGHWLGLKLRGRQSGLFPVGARVTCRAGGREQIRVLASGTGYLSTHDPRLWFGLGTSSQIESIHVRWPSGLEQNFAAPPINSMLELREGEAELRPRRGMGREANAHSPG